MMNDPDYEPKRYEIDKDGRMRPIGEGATPLEVWLAFGALGLAALACVLWIALT